MAKSRNYKKSKKVRRKGKHSRKIRKRTRHHKKRGGAISNGPLAPAPFLPPNGPVNVPVPGITNQQDQQYYYAKNNRVVPNPKSTNTVILKKYKGGKKHKSRKVHKKRHVRKSRKVNKKRKSHKGRKQHKRHRKIHRGGNLSKLVEVIPGGTDIRDVYYKAGNMVSNIYSQYTGYGPINEPPMTNYTSGQPIAKNGDVDGTLTPLAQYIGDGSNQAAKPEFSADYK